MTVKAFDVQYRLEHYLWPKDKRMPAVQLRLFKALRVVYAAISDLTSGELSLRAMSLVYTTLLSIVPLLALSFSVLKAMGAHNEIEPFLFQFLAPLGDQGVGIGENIIGFIDNIKVGVLGSLGLGLLIYTVLSLVKKIENAFNMIWHVEATRSIGERFSSYLSVILIGPVLMVSAVGLTATVMNSSVVSYFAAIEPFGSLIILATKLLPYILVMGVFTFIYIFVPNTRVRFGSAMLGAVVAGFLWETSSLLFAAFVVTSTKYTAIYSSFAVVIMLLIWLYINWLILLFGSSLAFYIQNPSAQRQGRHGFDVSNRVKERLGLLLIYLIGLRHNKGTAPFTIDELVVETTMPQRVVVYVLNKLIAKNIVIESSQPPKGYLPAKSIDKLLVSEVIVAVRSAEESRFLSVSGITLPGCIAEQADLIDQAIESAMEGKTVSDLTRLPSM